MKNPKYPQNRCSIHRKIIGSNDKLVVSKSSCNFEVNLKVRKKNAIWMPNLLTDEQKKTRVTMAKKLLKMYPKNSKKAFDNIIVTGDKTLVYYFEPKRKVANRI